jgi:hypothetical protein
MEKEAEPTKEQLEAFIRTARARIIIESSLGGLKSIDPDSLKKTITWLERAVAKRDFGEVERLAKEIKHTATRYRIYADWILEAPREILGCREGESLQECYERWERRAGKPPLCRTGEPFKECYERVRKEMGLPGIPI